MGKVLIYGGTGVVVVRMLARIVCGDKAIWALPIYTGHIAKRGFPNTL